MLTTASQPAAIWRPLVVWDAAALTRALAKSPERALATIRASRVVQNLVGNAVWVPAGTGDDPGEPCRPLFVLPKPGQGIRDNHDRRLRLQMQAVINGHMTRSETAIGSAEVNSLYLWEPRGDWHVGAYDSGSFFRTAISDDGGSDNMEGFVANFMDAHAMGTLAFRLPPSAPRAGQTSPIRCCPSRAPDRCLGGTAPIRRREEIPADGIAGIHGVSSPPLTSPP